MVSFIPLIPLSDELRNLNKFLFVGWVPLTKDILLLICQHILAQEINPDPLLHITAEESDFGQATLHKSAV